MLVVHSEARTPEELETLLEDALVLGDPVALSGLFEPAAIVAHSGRRAHGDQIATFLARLRGNGFTYVAEPHLVLRARNTALLVARDSISVVHRAADASWRFAITAIDPRGTTP